MLGLSLIDTFHITQEFKPLLLNLKMDPCSVEDDKKHLLLQAKHKRLKYTHRKDQREECHQKLNDKKSSYGSVNQQDNFISMRKDERNTSGVQQ